MAKKSRPIRQESAIDQHLPGVARAIYDSYPHADLLPIDPDKSCESVTRLAKDARASGDGLFSFLIDELLSVLDEESPNDYAKNVAMMFNNITRDVDSVRRAIERKVEEREDRQKAEIAARD